MKKLFSLFLFIIVLFPLSAFATSIDSATIKAPDTLNQGDSFDIQVELKFSGVGLDTVGVAAVAVEIKYDKDMLIIEDYSASNFNTSLVDIENQNVLVAVINPKAITIDEGSCSNNAFCNTFRSNIKVFAKGSGTAEFRLGEIAISIEDMKTEEESEVEYISTASKLINISEVNKEITLPPSITPEKEVQTTPPKITTQPTTTHEVTKKADEVVPTSEAPANEPTTVSTSTSETNNEEEKNREKEKQKKMNKKIIAYAVIALVIVILLFIANSIINKINNRKIDKLLNKL